MPTTTTRKTRRRRAAKALQPPHNGVNAHTALLIAEQPAGRFYIGTEPVPAERFAARCHELALERAAAARKLTLARVVDFDHVVAAMNTDGDPTWGTGAADDPDLALLALEAVMEQAGSIL